MINDESEIKSVVSELIILDDWNPSEETIRRWAYDLNILMAEQDEDLVFCVDELIPLLIELASDKNCPKATYILSILDFHTMFRFLRLPTDAVIPVMENAVELASQSANLKVAQWAELLKERIRFKKAIGRVDQETALTMGQTLLNGVCRQTEVAVVGEDEQTWTVGLSLPPHAESLKIDKETGAFIHEMSVPS